MKAIIVLALCLAVPVSAQTMSQDSTAKSSAAEASAQPEIVTCESTPGERRHCPANTSAGVAIQRSKGDGPCLLGKTWGYDDSGIWVSDGCSGEFVLGQVGPADASQPPATQPRKKPADRVETWGEFEPGAGSSWAGTAPVNCPPTAATTG